MPDHPPDFTPDEIATWEMVKPFTMASPERTIMLMRAVAYLQRWAIPGAFVECGVWRGGSMMAVARTAFAGGDSERSLYLFDTFSGMTPPSERDRLIASGRPAREILAASASDSPYWGVTDLETVRVNMESTGYPRERIHYVSGPVEETLPDRAPTEIALLRLDTDWYESTRHELLHLYPRLSPGGVLLVDDYGFWQGSREAVDEYLAALPTPLLLCRVDYTARIAVKPR